MNSAIDENNVPTMIAITPSGGIGRLLVDPATGAVKVSDGQTAIGTVYSAAFHDENTKATITGVSSADFKTPIPAHLDNAGNLYIDSH
jgi:hypothetical protein